MQLNDDNLNLIDSPAELIGLLGATEATGKLTNADHLALGFAACDRQDAVTCRKHSEVAMTDPGLNTSRLHHTLGTRLDHLHDESGAAEHFKVAYEIEPQNTTYRYDYEHHPQ